MRPNKLDAATDEIKALVAQLYAQGVTYPNISETLKAQGFDISYMSVKRWLEKQPGYIPRSQMVPERVDLSDDLKPCETFEADSITYDLPTLPESPTERSEVVIKHFDELLIKALAVANQAFTRHFEGKVKYPTEQIKGLAQILSMCHKITGRGMYEKVGRNIIDLESALKMQADDMDDIEATNLLAILNSIK
jgi:hypothetical protein